jgi:DNA-directed RNA polymerase, mitochondrial
VSTIQEQLALEEQMVARGVLRHKARTTAHEKNDRGSETDYGRHLTKNYLIPLGEAIRMEVERKGANRNAKIRAHLKSVDADTAAFFLLRGVFNSFLKESPVSRVAINIGRMVEDEIRFSRFREMNADYYDAIIKDFKRKGTKNYRHMHRVLTHKANEKGHKWKEWSVDERVKVGAKLIEIMLKNTDLIEIGKLPKKKITHQSQYVLKPTEQAKDWIKRYGHYSSMLDPDRMPCLIDPDPWINAEQGGYYSPQMRSTTPLILNMQDRHKKLLAGADIMPTLTAVNALQATPWRVNKPVAMTMKIAWEHNLAIGMPATLPYEIPTCPIAEDQEPSELNAIDKAKFEDWKMEASLVYTAERERASKCFQLSRALRMASNLEDADAFYYVYQLCFRGRAYAASSGMSPQGTDTAKALLQFARGLPVGDHGGFWLRVHGANVYGFDKASYADRASFIEGHRDEIVLAASDPLGHREFWTNADKPWQFLAFCFEYAGMLSEGAAFENRLPVALDGSCNGLQHFSAILRDPIGGAATNLCQSDSPSDIYSEVASVCTKALLSRVDELAIQWVSFCKTYGGGCIPRDLAKRPVMTLPYGSTQRSCTDHIFQYIRSKQRGFFSGGDFKAAVYLTSILWAAIGQVVVAARSVMDWVQRVAGIQARRGTPLIWTTPLGFPVLQQNFEIEHTQIETQIAGRIQLRIGKFTDKLDLNRQKQGASPNFVHSIDATHMQMVILVALAEGITDFAMIHDSFGTHACNIPAFNKIIRDTFVVLHQPGNLLESYREEQGNTSLPEPPSSGTLDILGVRKADYFFG